MLFPDFSSMCSRGCRSAQFLPVLPGVGQASPNLFRQDFSFEFGKNCEQAGHWLGPPGQVQCRSQRDETDAEMLQFLKRRQQVRYRSALPTSSQDLEFGLEDFFGVCAWR